MIHKRIKQKDAPKHKVPGQDRYLITYADLLTLLFALFVILYSISSPDIEKAQEILQAMNTIFNPNQMIDGNNKNPDIITARTPPVVLFHSQALNIPEVQENMQTALSQLVSKKLLNFEKTNNGVKIILPDKLLFAPAKAQLIASSKEIFDSLAPILAGINMQIQVDGHTDASPIKSFTYASNWELSSARAVNVAQALISRGVPAFNLVVRAYGEQRPIADNVSDEGKEKNRRVEIIITPKDDNAATINETADSKK
jgi:chemotaxis protein MotB